MKNILVLCIGNICRSPMAEGLLKRALPDAVVHSAGIDALIGHPADPASVQLMQEAGIDISAHRARGLTSKMVSDSDLILTMDLEQKRFVESKYVTSKGKVFRLGEFKGYDIADPYRQGMESFREAYVLIDQGVEHIAARILRMV